MTTPYLKGAANTHVAFLQKHSTLNLQWWKLRLKHHTCYVLHYFKFSPLLADILADIFLNMFLTSLPRHSLWTSFRHIFWHSWHIFDHSFWHILSELLADISSDILSDLSCDILQLLLWHTLSATTTNPFDHSWGPARHTELTSSRLGSGTPHWTRMIVVGVRHATLNSQDRSWGPARHTELTRSQLGSGTPHWTRMIAVGVRHATLNSRARGWGPARHTELTGSRLRSGMPHWTHKIVVEVRRGGGRRGEGGREGEEGEETDIKSNNPDLTGGEKTSESSKGNKENDYKPWSQNSIDFWGSPIPISEIN